jgi:hypothetical protein
VEGKTGLFFREPSPAALAAVVEHFEELDFDTGRIRQHAERFSRPVFEQQITRFVEQKLEAFEKRWN